MRIGVISDIHGNAVALEAALEDLSRHEVDQIVCLGDALQGGFQPADVVDRLRDVACPVVLGNADAFLVDEPQPGTSERMLAVREWTRKQLGDAGLEFIRAFVPTHTVPLSGEQALLCFHGSPGSFDDVLLPETHIADVRKALGDTDATVLCGGHTHLQWTVGIDARTFFNPGSVGLAYNRYMPRERFHFYAMAEYAIVAASEDGSTIEFKHVPYDVDALEKAAMASGHPFAEAEVGRWRPPAQG